MQLKTKYTQNLFENFAKDVLATIFLLLVTVYQAYLVDKIPFTLFYASTDYYVFANNYLFGNQQIDAVNTASLRTLAYPAFLWFVSFGALDFHSIATSKLILVILVPVVAFWMMRHSNLRFGYSFFVSTAIAFSFAIPAASRTILNEQLYSAALTFLVISAICFHKSRKPQYLIILLGFWLLASLTRPTAFLGLPIILVFLFGDNIKQKFILFIATTIIAFVLISVTNKIHEKFVPNYSSGTGLLGLIGPIVESAKHDEWRFSRQDGSYTSTLINIVNEYELSERGEKGIAVHREKMRLPEKHGLTFKCNELTVEPRLPCLLEHPTLESYWQIKWAAIRAIGNKETDILFRNVFIEQLLSKPQMILSFWSENIKLFILGGNRRYSYQYQAELDKKNEFKVIFTGKKYNQKVEKFFKKTFVEDLNNHNSKREDKNRSSLDKFLYGVWNILAKLNLLTVCFALFFSVKLILFKANLTLNNAAIVFTAGLFLLHAFTVTAFHPPLGRYIIPLIPLMSIGFAALVMESFCLIFRNYRVEFSIKKK